MSNKRTAFVCHSVGWIGLDLGKVLDKRVWAR